MASRADDLDPSVVEQHDVVAAKHRSQIRRICTAVLDCRDKLLCPDQNQASHDDRTIPFARKLLSLKNDTHLRAPIVPANLLNQLICHV